jgi:microcystin-dependent protein
MAVLAPISGLPRFKNGKLVANAAAYFYEAGTTTPRTTYQDVGGAEHPQPVLALGDGNFPAIYVQGSGAYKIRLTEGAGGALLAEYDNLAGDATASGSGGSTSSQWVTGDVKWRYDTGLHAGWVRANGESIGSAIASPSPTERANDDCFNLFVHLWNKDPSLDVSTGRGVSAELDWENGKTIALPDIKGRTLVGLADMGASFTSNRLNGGTFSSGDTSTDLGATGGSASQTLTVAQLAVHSHPSTATTFVSSSGSGTFSYTAPQAPATVQAGTGTTAVPGGVSTPGSATLVISSSASTTLDNATAGSGSGHNNLPPFILGTYYVKL